MREMSGYRQLIQMFIIIAFFNASEYLVAIHSHGRANVSLRYLLVTVNCLSDIIGAVVEYLLEMIFFPGLKEHWWISNVGLAVVVLGELIRIVAMITAGRAFTHQLKTSHEEQHRMVRHGIYGIVRHPGYLGYLVWIVGIQVMLLNPVCAVVIGIAVRNFFAERISQEEYHLKRFFGPDYVAYAKRVPSGIPFVN